jgi:hypothetical protein
VTYGTKPPAPVEPPAAAASPQIAASSGATGGLSSITPQVGPYGSVPGAAAPADQSLPSSSGGFAAAAPAAMPAAAGAAFGAGLQPEGAATRVMSLRDGTSKMSKSDPNDNSRINILDPPDIIRSKIKKCKTDALQGIEWDNPERPEATNLLNIYLAVQPTGTSKEEVVDRVKDMTWGEFKPVLADAIIDHVLPIQERYHALRKDDAYLQKVLREGAEAANDIASKTLAAARIAMGFVPPTN